MKKSWKIQNLNELDNFAKQLINIHSGPTAVNQATIITLSGDLGTGKTALAQRIAKHIGITEDVSSPTFVIAKYYDLGKVGSPTSNFSRMIHIDAYRLEDEPLEPLGFDQLFNDPSSLIIIEWPEYIESVLPASRTNVSIAINTDESRLITVSL